MLSLRLCIAASGLSVMTEPYRQLAHFSNLCCRTYCINPAYLSVLRKLPAIIKSKCVQLAFDFPEHLNHRSTHRTRRLALNMRAEEKPAETLC